MLDPGGQISGSVGERLGRPDRCRMRSEMAFVSTVETVGSSRASRELQMLIGLVVDR
jgi:hypothetical protein